MWAYRKVQCIAKKEAMERRRTLETEQESKTGYVNRGQGQLKQISARRRSDRLRKETTRASETIEQMLHRHGRDKQHKETTSASETIEQTLHRQHSPTHSVVPRCRGFCTLIV
jgi:hypothetical protein